MHCTSYKCLPDLLHRDRPCSLASLFEEMKITVPLLPAAFFRIRYGKPLERQSRP